MACSHCQHCTALEMRANRGEAYLQAVGLIKQAGLAEYDAADLLYLANYLYSEDDDSDGDS